MNLVIRAKQRGQFGDSGRGAVKTGASREPQRLGEVVPEIDAVPVVADPSVEQVSLQRQFDGDGQEVARRLWL
jgi:hypothetical protein